MSFAEEQINEATLEALKMQFSALAELDESARQTLDKLVSAAVVYGMSKGIDECQKILEKRA
jgi:hypothetical protein